VTAAAGRVPDPFRLGRVDDLVFEVTQEGDGGYCAECLTESIFTQGETWDELRANVKEAVDAFYFDRPKPASVRLHLVKDELLAAG
jgi:predicted RNase H-like HicB family nuclease